MTELEDDDGALQQLDAELATLFQQTNRYRLEVLLNEEADPNPCFLEVHAGAGGTEAQDWAEMLLRMYSRWGESKGFKVEWIDENAGEDAGIKWATLKITGHMAYGWLKTESGVHRLVRISPFDSSNRRHTSFASVWVYPEIDDNITIDIADSDLRIDTFRASGAGGQHVNTTESAIRITHIPTGVVVQCQNDRSQHKNKATAMKVLKSRLYERELRKRMEASTQQSANRGDNGWGNQIRSYVLAPYQMVKDLRTSHETSNTTAVLNGDLDGFLETSLVHNKGFKE